MNNPVTDAEFHIIIVGKDTWYDFSLLKFAMTCDLSHDLPWRMSCACLRRMYIQLLLDGMISTYL